ncbi:MAG TPA: twin-arginine translocase TatA/TatE family subunit [Ktedonobacterales bacterium]|nr:twin-arginine translocase TatA/TatE family subunit [Ktedonobacterales bacterium]
MPFIGHLPELMIVLVLALLVFGPKRMIEMGSSLGKSLAELRRSLKDVPGLENLTSLGGLLKDDDEPRRTPFSSASQFAQNFSIASKDEAEAVPAPAAATVVDAAPPAEAPPTAPVGVPPTVVAPETPAPHIVPVTAPGPAEPGAE